MSLPDDGPPVGPLEVAPHDLVEPAVAEDEAGQLEAPRPQQVDRLLVLVGEAERLVVPAELEVLQADAVAGHGVDLDWIVRQTLTLSYAAVSSPGGQCVS